MQRLVNNPLFRIVGIVLILYYGLFANKEHPESLGNRLSPERVKENLHEVSSKSVDIMANIKKVEEIKKNMEVEHKKSAPTQESEQALEQPLEQKAEENKDLNNVSNEQRP